MKYCQYVENLENHEFEHSVQLLKSSWGTRIIGADVPEAYGGLGLDKVASALIAEKMSRAGGFSITHGAHVGIGSFPIVLFGNEEQKKKYLPNLLLEKNCSLCINRARFRFGCIRCKNDSKIK